MSSQKNIGQPQEKVSKTVETTGNQVEDTAQSVHNAAAAFNKADENVDAALKGIKAIIDKNLSPSEDNSEIKSLGAAELEQMNAAIKKALPNVKDLNESLKNLNYWMQKHVDSMKKKAKKYDNSVGSPSEDQTSKIQEVLTRENERFYMSKMGYTFGLELYEIWTRYIEEKNYEAFKTSWNDAAAEMKNYINNLNEIYKAKVDTEDDSDELKAVEDELKNYNVDSDKPEVRIMQSKLQHCWVMKAKKRQLINQICIKEGILFVKAANIEEKILSQETSVKDIKSLKETFKSVSFSISNLFEGWLVVSSLYMKAVEGILDDLMSVQWENLQIMTKKELLDYTQRRAMYMFVEPGDNESGTKVAVFTKAKSEATEEELTQKTDELFSQIDSHTKKMSNLDEIYKSIDKEDEAQLVDYVKQLDTFAEEYWHWFQNSFKGITE